MTILKSSLNTSSEEFRIRYAHNKRLAAELHEKNCIARFVRPQRDLERLAKQGKMTPRERLEKLLDPGTPFLEFSTLAANMAYGGEFLARARSPASAWSPARKSSSMPTICR